MFSTSGIQSRLGGAPIRTFRPRSFKPVVADLLPPKDGYAPRLRSVGPNEEMDRAAQSLGRCIWFRFQLVDASVLEPPTLWLGRVVLAFAGCGLA